MAENVKIIAKHPAPSSNITDYTPEPCEIIVDDKKWQFRIGDGTTPGGRVIGPEFSFKQISTPTNDLEAYDCALVDCRTQSITLNLPANPAQAAQVKVLDIYYAASQTYQINVVPNTDQKINNVNEPFIIDIPRSYISFIYIEETKNWIVDLGGIISPTYTLETSDELFFDQENGNVLSINYVSGSKIKGGIIDLGTF